MKTHFRRPSCITLPRCLSLLLLWACGETESADGSAVDGSASLDASSALDGGQRPMPTWRPMGV